MARMGFIYLITNTVDGMKYVGQTSRDIETRFAEHCVETRGHSRLHLAIQKYGWTKFKVEQLEQCPIDKLDEREIYWIKKLDTYNNGYNLTPGGSNINFNVSHVQHLKIVENNLIVFSREELARLICETTSWWSIEAAKKIIANAMKNNRPFLGYHIVPVEIPSLDYLSDEDTIIDWIKTLNIRYQGKHIFCNELDKEFNTVGEAARYLFDNGYYNGTAKMPIQSLITRISYNMKGKTAFVESAAGPLTFVTMPGTTKQPGTATPYIKKKVYCRELDKEFNSMVEAASYMIDNNYWTGIKLKTAKMRISDIVRGVFPNYKGYTFSYAGD